VAPRFTKSKPQELDLASGKSCNAEYQPLANPIKFQSKMVGILFNGVVSELALMVRNERARSLRGNLDAAN
jgi:hypothetical protein